MSISFFERYQKEDTWYGKVIVIEIFHLAMCQREKDWTIAKTAESFDISIGLVSENLRIAAAMHRNSKLINCKTRTEALRKI